MLRGALGAGRWCWRRLMTMTTTYTDISAARTTTNARRRDREDWREPGEGGDGGAGPSVVQISTHSLVGSDGSCRGTENERHG